MTIKRWATLSILAASAGAAGSHASAQITQQWLSQHQGVRSVAGRASTFTGSTDLTIFWDGPHTVLQITEYNGHYMGLTGTLIISDPTVIDLDQVFYDGQPAGSQSGQCQLHFKDGALSEITCPALTFTTKGN